MVKGREVEECLLKEEMGEDLGVKNWEVGFPCSFLPLTFFFFFFFYCHFLGSFLSFLH